MFFAYLPYRVRLPSKCLPAHFEGPRQDRRAGKLDFVVLQTQFCNLASFLGDT